MTSGWACYGLPQGEECEWEFFSLSRFLLFLSRRRESSLSEKLGWERKVRKGEKEGKRGREREEVSKKKYTTLLLHVNIISDCNHQVLGFLLVKWVRFLNSHSFIGRAIDLFQMTMFLMAVPFFLSGFLLSLSLSYSSFSSYYATITISEWNPGHFYDWKFYLHEWVPLHCNEYKRGRGREGMEG